jgi:hypothetical protein
MTDHRNDPDAVQRELIFVCGLRTAARLASAEGDHSAAHKIMQLACSPEETFILANTVGDLGCTTETRKPHSPCATSSAAQSNL